MIQTQASELWKISTENPEDEQVNNFLDDLMEEKHTGFEIVDVLQKFHLRKLHKTSKITKSVTWTTSTIVLVLLAILILYSCKRYKKSQHQNFRPRMNVRFSDLVNESYVIELEKQPKETGAEATNAVKPKMKTVSKH